MKWEAYEKQEEKNKRKKPARHKVHNKKAFTLKVILSKKRK